MKSFIAKLIRPLIMETLRQIHGERADQADAARAELDAKRNPPIDLLISLPPWRFLERD
jgi:hypothetical protein